MRFITARDFLTPVVGIACKHVTWYGSGEQSHKSFREETPKNSMHDRLHTLQSILHHEIPLTRHLGLKVESYDGQCLTLRAPIAPNINHKSTAFAGSLNAVMTLAGWGLIWLLLDDTDLAGTIVIQRSDTRYVLPVRDDFIARCQKPSAEEIARFVATLRSRGKARLELAVEVLQEGKLAVAFSGRYVAHGHKRE
jgi:thioesterase domain-containing protein